jgi:hypothetical protein
MNTCPSCGFRWWACACSRRQREDAWHDPYSPARLDPTYSHEDDRKFEDELQYFDQDEKK